MYKIVILLVTLIMIQCSIPLKCEEATKYEECLSVINGIYECIWYNNNCVEKSCNNIKGPCDGDAYKGVNCATTNNQQCKSVQQCSDIDNQQSCNIVQPYGTQCYWQDNCRNKTCYDNQKQQCQQTNSELCVYQNEQCQPIKKCSDVLQQQQCENLNINNSITCVWNQNKCIEGSCQLIQFADECFKSVINNENCFYTRDNVNGNGCLSCNQITEQCTCDHYNLFGCWWQKDQCKQLNCQSFTTSKDCQDSYDTLTCTWYAPMNKCMTIYEASEFDRKCDIYSWGQLLTIITLIIILQ